MAKLPTGVVTFLFTDLEGSTRLWEYQPDAMHEALAQHDAILTQAIESHDGVVFSKMGDGMAAAFESAGAGVAAALDAQLELATAPWGATGPLRVRMGLHAAEAQLRSNVDYVNRPLNQCARLMAVASGGQVLLSETAETLVRGNLPADTKVIDLGSHRLRDLANPVHIFQVAHPELPVDFPPLRSLDAFPAITTMPKPSILREERRLAGRSAELDALARAWTRATDGSRQVTLVMGEPGIGKTRLVGELSRQVDAQGGVVLYGGCDEDTIIPYQPFVEALRPFVAAYPLSTMHERLHGLEQDLTRVFPEMLGRFAASPQSRASDPEAERYRLFEAITALLTGIATAQSTLLVLDDLHWADKPTALLLRHVIRSTPEAALHIVACYRDVEVPRDHPLANLLSDLRRESFVERVTVRALTEADTGALLDDLAGQPLTASLSGALHRETGGNPLFVAELFRHLTETEVLPRPPNAPLEIDFGPLDLPDGVRDVVARRLTRLPAEVNDVLRLAAVFGSEFGAVLLGRATEEPVEEILGALEQAQAAGLVEEHPDRLGWYTFAHALVRQTLYSELGTARRARLHARAGVAMEQTTGLQPPAAALAHHFTQAVPLGQAPKAIEYTTKAGHEAVADLAFEEAAAAFEAVLALLEQHAPEDAAQRVDVLTDLADALVYVDERAGVEAALRAVEAARAHGSARQLGRAVTIFVEPTSAVFARVDVADLFDEAMVALGDDHADLRARLLALMAFKYAVYQLQGRDGRELARDAVSLARSVGDAETLADALFALAVSSEGSADVSNRLALGEELVGLGRSGSGRAAKATAYGLRILAGVHLEVGDAELLTSTIAELARVGHDQRWLPARVYAAQWEATQALLEARFDDVLICWKEMRGLVPAYRGAASMQATQMYYLAREHGGLGDIASVLERIAEENHQNLYVRAMLALAQCDAGDDAAARRSLDLLLAGDFRSRARESSWGAVLGLLAEVAAQTGARSQAELLYELLIPFEGRLLTAVLGLGCLGAADRYLGMLSTVAERWDDAEAHFERALVVEERIRGRGLRARTRYWHARFVRARGRDGDQLAATGLLSEVAEEASRLGLRRVAESAQALLGA